VLPRRKKPRNAVKFTKNLTILVNLSGVRALATWLDPGQSASMNIFSFVLLDS